MLNKRESRIMSGYWIIFGRCVPSLTYERDYLHSSSLIILMKNAFVEKGHYK